MRLDLPQLSPSSVNCLSAGNSQTPTRAVSQRPKREYRPLTTAANRKNIQAMWREQKRRQRKDPLAKEKRRAYYLLNRARLLERQRAYYHAVWKLKECGIDVSRPGISALAGMRAAHAGKGA